MIGEGWLRPEAYQNVERGNRLCTGALVHWMSVHKTKGRHFLRKESALHEAWLFFCTVVRGEAAIGPSEVKSRI